LSTQLTFLAEALHPVRVHPWIVAVGEGAEAGVIGTNLGLGSPNDDGIQHQLVALEVLPPAQFVALDFSEVGVREALVMLLLHHDDSPGPSPVMGRSGPASVEEELVHGPFDETGELSASLLEILLVSLAPATERSSGPRPLVLGLETLNGMQVHVCQLCLCGSLRPHHKAAGHVIVVLDFDAEHLEALHRHLPARAVRNVPCFVDGLIGRFIFVEAAITGLAH
jgi:hypothetical protein